MFQVVGFEASCWRWTTISGEGEPYRLILIACYSLRYRMSSGFCDCDWPRRLGEGATHPIARMAGRLAGLPVVAETAPAPCSRLACRPGCGACCIAPSISSLGKPAGMACTHLNRDLRCEIFGRPERPACCSGLQPSEDMCGSSREHAIAWLTELESATAESPTNHSRFR